MNLSCLISTGRYLEDVALHCSFRHCHVLSARKKTTKFNKMIKRSVGVAEFINRRYQEVGTARYLNTTKLVN